MTIPSPAPTRRTLLAGVLASALLALGGCSSSSPRDGAPSIPGVIGRQPVPRVEPPARGANRPYTVLGRRYVPVTGDRPMTMTGTASWYGRQFHGKKTSNGEIYNMFSLTAAHKTMELPSYAKVTNLANGRSLIVRVNDRGPFVDDRIIDLSYGAAVELGFERQGTARVRVERITRAQIARGDIPSTSLAQGSGRWTSRADDAPPPRSEPTRESMRRAEEAVDTLQASAQGAPAWFVQIGSFRVAGNAREFQAHAQAVLAAEGISEPVRLLRDGDLLRVLVGRWATAEEARGHARSLGSVLGLQAFPVKKRLR